MPLDAPPADFLDHAVANARAALLVYEETVLEAFASAEAAGLRLGDAVARAAWQTAAGVLGGAAALDVAVFDREGHLVGHHI